MKIVLYTNIMTPYRKYFYDLFYEECRKNGDQFTVLVMAENENNRVWRYNDYSASYTKLLKGFTLSWGETYIHFNKALRKELNDISPDVVIASGSYLCPGTWTILHNKRNIGYKALFWSESHLGEVRDYGTIKIRIRETLRKNFYKQFDAFLCPGELAKNFVREYSSSGKIIHLPNLIQESQYETTFGEISDICKKYHEAGKTILFTPARLSPVKGLVPFMDLLAKCSNKDKVAWLIAGSGELQANLEEKAKDSGICIELLGNKTAKEVAILYQNIDIFCLPSLSDPNPLTCVEAIWSGKPLLISSHVGNYPEVVDEGINGFVFSYENEEEAIKKIEKCIGSNKIWRKEAGEHSLCIAQNIYNSIKVTSRVRNEISMLI